MYVFSVAADCFPDTQVIAPEFLCQPFGSDTRAGHVSVIKTTRYSPRSSATAASFDFIIVSTFICRARSPSPALIAS